MISLPIGRDILIIVQSYGKTKKNLLLKISPIRRHQQLLRAASTRTYNRTQFPPFCSWVTNLALRIHTCQHEHSLDGELARAEVEQVLERWT